MGPRSVEQRVWDRLEDIKRWEFLRSPYMKEDFPSLGKLPAVLALSLGNSPILFASGEVSELDEVNGFPVFLVDVTFVAINGVHHARAKIGRQELSNPVVTWEPLSSIVAASLDSSKSWWDENTTFGATLTLSLKDGRTFKLFPGIHGVNTPIELIETYNIIQSASAR